MKHAILMLAVFSAFACLLSAQEFRSTLTGRVTDPSGAPVPNAKIQVRNTDTDSRFNTVSGPDGYYTVPFLVPGPYEVTTEVRGFKQSVLTGIQVSTATQVTENIALEIGSVSQSVEVSGRAPLVDTETASAGQVITTQEVENLPINGRSPIGLARFAYGVIPKQKHALTEVRPFDNSGAGDFSLGGANANSNEYLLNGVPNMVDGSRVSAFSPLMDAVNEVRVDEFQTDAAYGDTLGGTVNITTKSGTNQFHGSAMAFNETSALAANPFFLNAAGLRQPVTSQNEYGGTVGGPVLIPKLLNGRNKVFFFFAYEGFKDSNPHTTTTTVPTAAERQGDFSALLSLNRPGADYTIYDPLTAVMQGTQIKRSPIQCNGAPNVICPGRLNPIALKYLQYFPSPNQPGQSDGLNNYVVNDPTRDNYSSFMGRLDVNVSDRDKLFFDYHTSSYTNSSADIFSNLATGQFGGLDLLGSTLDDVHTFSPTLLLDTRLGFSRSYTTSSIKSNGFDVTQLGFPSYMLANSTQPALPRITFSDAYAGLSTNPGSIAAFDTLQLFSTLTKVANHHSVKFGADLRRERYSKLNGGFASGTFTFGTTWVTSANGSVAPKLGGSMASFLLGLPTSGQYDVIEPTTSSNYYFGFFLQDDWHITRNLTLNLGLRLEHETAVVESNNRETVGFDPNAINQVTRAAQAAYVASPIPQLPVSAFQPTGGLLFASSSQCSGYSTPAAFWAPRIGFSWAPSALHNKAVFRGGMGVFNNPYGAYTTGPSTGFTQTTLLVPTNNSFITPYGTLSDPFPGGSIQQPPGSSQGVNTYLGNSVSFYYPNFKDPYSIRWSFDIQRQFGKDWMLDVGYIGNHQVHLTTSNFLSAVPLLPFLSRSQLRDPAVNSMLSAIVPNPFAGLLPGSSLNGRTTSVATLLNAYPEFTGVSESTIPNAYGWFHMLAVRLTKRFSHGLQMSLNYEHSRLLEAISQLNQGDPHLWYGVPTADFPEHLALAASYNLPFGRGARFLDNPNRLLNAVVSGWVLNTIYVWESGPALSWGNVIYYGGDLNNQPRNLRRAFDTAQFDTNTNDQPNGNNYRTFPTSFNNLRADAANNVDLSLLKSFKIRERLKLQYRFEAFNAFNRTQFAAANLSPTSTAFGTINSQANTPRVVQMGLRLTF